MALYEVIYYQEEEDAMPVREVMEAIDLVALFDNKNIVSIEATTNAKSAES